MGGALSMATAQKGGKVAWVVPTYKNGRSLWRWAENVTAEARKAGVIISNKSERMMEFPGGGLFGIYSADNEDGIRGEAFHLAILDEAARISETAWTDAIQPTLADYDGDAILISTPKGKNWFFNEYMIGKDDGVHQASFHAPSSANPNPKIRAAAEKARDKVTARTYHQEWLAEFVADGAYFQGVEACAIVTDKDTPEQHTGHYLVLAADWAMSQDWTVIGVGCRDCNRVVDWDRFNQIEYTYQRERLYTMADRWGVAGILPERNSIGQPNIEIIRQSGRRVLRGPDGSFGYNTTATTKPALIQGLASALEHHGFLVPKAAGDELRSYEVETLVSGHPKFSAPEGLHDDWVMMLAILWYAMTDQSGWLFI
jgi:hypothetical protein